MLNFLEYRRKNLQDRLLKLKTNEFIELNLDVFKGDLLESIKLPNLLFESSIIFESSYDDTRKKDYKENKEIIEFLLQNTKNEITQIISEADAALGNELANDKQKAMLRAHGYQANAIGSGHKALGDDELNNLTKAQASKLLDRLQKDFPLVGKNSDQFLKNLETSIRSSTEKLKKYLSDVLSQTRPMGDVPTPSVSQPAASSQSFAPRTQTPQPSFSQAMRTPDQVPVQPQNQQAGPTVASGSADKNVSVQEPDDDGSFTPAPRGSWKPADGWWPGIKRAVVDPVGGWLKNKWQGLGNAWRTFRRRWHNDKLREHENFLENLFLENENQIMQAVDDFTNNLIKNINQRFNYYISNLHGDQNSDVGTSSNKSTNVAAVQPRQASASVQEPEQDDEDQDANVKETPTWNKESLIRVLKELFPDQYEDGKVIFSDKSYIEIMPRASKVVVKGSNLVRNQILEKISRKKWFITNHHDEIKRKRNGELTKECQNYILGVFGINTFSANPVRINHILANYEKVKMGQSSESLRKTTPAAAAAPQEPTNTDDAEPKVKEIDLRTGARAKEAGMHLDLYNALKEKGLFQKFNAWKDKLEDPQSISTFIKSGDKDFIDYVINELEKDDNNSEPQEKSTPVEDDNNSEPQEEPTPTDDKNDSEPQEELASTTEQKILTIKDLDETKRGVFVKWKNNNKDRKIVREFLENKYGENSDDYMRLRDSIWIEKILGNINNKLTDNWVGIETKLINQEQTLEKFIESIKEFKGSDFYKINSVSSGDSPEEEVIDSEDTPDRGSELPDEENIDWQDDEQY